MSLKRALILAVLASINTVIVVSGLWFTSTNIIGQYKIPVFGVQVPAYLLGIMVVYIGVKSYIKLYRLAKMLRDPQLKFSWHNFRGGI